MPDYKAMYLKLFGSTEDAINRLIEAQRACEEMYISCPDPEDEVQEESEESF